MKAMNHKSYFCLSPNNLSEAMEFAKLVASSNLVPRHFQGKPGDILIAIQMGSELNLPPLQALQNIAVINGRPCLWGDALLAVVKAHPEFEYLKEYEENQTAVCQVKRKNQPEHTATFSQADAAKAQLANKPGPWQQYPKRMRQMRARAFALRDTFPDALKGIAVAEEVQDTLPAFPAGASKSLNTSSNHKLGAAAAKDKLSMS